MIRAKLIFIYTVISVFIGVSTVGILAACGVIKMPDVATAAALIGPCLGIVSTVVAAKHIFEDPEAMTKLKQEHYDAELSANRTTEKRVADAVARERTSAAQQHQRDQQAHAALHTENQQLKLQLQKSQAEVVHQQHLVATYKPKQINPASGSARTQ